MTCKTKLFITWAFTLCLFGLCVHSINKWQDVEANLIVNKNELKITQQELINQIDLNDGLRKRVEETKKAEEALQILKSPEYEFVYLGNFKLTAYCSCEICCDMYAYNRPLDQNGNPIVFTASGTIAKEGRTIGVNPMVIPYGTRVYILGQGFFIAEDTGSGIETNHIDIYMGSHEAALSSGLSRSDVWVLVQK